MGLFRNFEQHSPMELAGECSEADIAFHRSIIRLSGRGLMVCADALRRHDHASVFHHFRDATETGCRYDRLNGG